MMKRTNNNNEQGFVALITSIVLSCILITAAVTLNMSGFFTRSALLDSEYKERSSALSEACADTARLRIAADPTYQVASTTPQQLTIGTDTCWIHSVELNTPVSGQDTIKTQGKFNEATTNLRIVVEASDLSVQSWDEITSF